MKKTYSGSNEQIFSYRIKQKKYLNECNHKIKNRSYGSTLRDHHFDKILEHMKSGKVHSQSFAAEFKSDKDWDEKSRS
jgi:hypothetical protein